MKSFIGETAKERFIYTFIWLLLALSVYGIFSNVLINPPIGEALNIIGGILTILISVSVVKLAWFGENSPFKVYDNFLQRAVVAMGYSCFIHYSIFLIFERGGPIVIHNFLPHESAIKIVTVESVNATDKKCLGCVYIKGNTSSLDKKLCDIPDKLVSKLKADDKLTLHGTKSFIGFSYTRIAS
jgi:hypothetical protein